TEGMVDPPEAGVRRARERSLKDVHPGGEPAVARPQYNVVVVMHQRPPVDRPALDGDDAAEQAQELSSELVVEDPALVVAARADVEELSRGLKARLARHPLTVGAPTAVDAGPG